MAPSGRTRQLDLRFTHTGKQFIVSSGTTLTSTVLHGEITTTADVIGNYGGVNPFSLSRRHTQRGLFSGTNRAAGGQPLRIVTAMPSGSFAPPDPWTKFGVLDITAQKAALISGLHNSSPATPHLEVPQALGELKDLPDLIRPFAPLVHPSYLGALARSQSSGGSLAKGVANIPSLLRGFGNTLIGWAANGYISWRWAIKPMLADIRRCLELSSLIEKRARQLERLRRGESVKRKVRVRGRATSEVVKNIAISSDFGPVIRADRWISHREDVWFACRWKLSASAEKSPYIHPIRDRQQALSVLMGVNSLAALKTAWELMPWSWFADWFGQVGDILAINTPAFPAYHSDACLMRTCRSYCEYIIVPESMPAWVSLVQAPYESWTRKERVPDTALWFPALPPVNFPLLDSGKWSILSALACSSADRGLPGIWRRKNMGGTH